MLYYCYYYTLFLPRGKVRPADKLQLKAAILLPLVGLARSKQDPINRGRGAQYLCCPPPARASMLYVNVIFRSLMTVHEQVGSLKAPQNRRTRQIRENTPDLLCQWCLCKHHCTCNRESRNHYLQLRARAVTVGHSSASPPMMIAPANSHRWL